MFFADVSQTHSWTAPVSCPETSCRFNSNLSSPAAPQTAVSTAFTCLFNTYSVKKNASACVILLSLEIYNMLLGSRAHFKQGSSSFTSKRSVLLTVASIFIVSTIKRWMQNILTFKGFTHMYFLASGGGQWMVMRSEGLKRLDAKSNHKRALRSTGRLVMLWILVLLKLYWIKCIYIKACDS